MNADFEKSLEAAQKAEAKSLKEFESLRVAKESEIASAKKAVTQMDAQLAEASEKHAQAAQEFEDTQAQLELDRTFLAKLKEKCAMSAEEFDTRVKDRMAEIAAVQDTIKILNSDESFDNFDKTVSAALLQTGAAGHALEKRQRQRAAALLRRAAGATGTAQLMALANA